MTGKRSERRGFSFSLVYASFFGALMIALAYAYYNHKFSQYNFIDFSKIVLYSKESVFMPEKDRYTVVLYSSKQNNIDTVLERLKEQQMTVLAIDLYMQRRGARDDVTFLTAGTNTLLRLIHRFAVRKVPSYFRIKKENDNGLYKQDSKIFTF